MNLAGCYKLDCWNCGHTVTTPAADGIQSCPSCGADLDIQWHAEVEGRAQDGAREAA